MFRFIPFLILAVLAHTAAAGTLTAGRWTPTGCGTAPAVPTIAANSADAYNQSLKAVRAWQEQAQAYNNCLVREANADNQTIAEAANVAQEQFRAQVADIGTRAEAIKAKLDAKQ